MDPEHVAQALTTRRTDGHRVSRYGLLFLATMLCVLNSPGSVPPLYAAHGVQTVRIIYADSAHDLVESGRQPMFIDLRSPDEFQKTRLPGARSIPLGEISRRYGEIAREGQVILYCECRGEDLEWVYRFLVDRGYQNISVMPGGITDWLRKRFPVER